MIPPSEAAEKLPGYPEEVLQAYADYYRERRSHDLDRVVFGLIAFLLPEPPERPLHELPDSTDLRADLQIDSITIAEVVFIIEDLFDLKISNDTLMSLQTTGDLKNHLRKELAG
ncbi:MAG: hypothetical protein JJU00_07835 [Opitutales bacterium]|nr:hypothetical protein [Opitutales bacterium]